RSHTILVVPAKAGTEGVPFIARPGFPLARRAVRGKFLTALPTSPHDEWYTLRSSCPALCRASTSLSTPKKDVDGRDKPGHDDERESSAADLQPHFFPRTALRL